MKSRSHSQTIVYLPHNLSRPSRAVYELGRQVERRWYLQERQRYQ
jgi:hypothetical protein